MTDFASLEIDGPVLVTPRRHGDHRGSFTEVYNRRDFIAGGIAAEFVQDNHSVSRESGTLRGLHYQLPPFAQAKLVRVAQGRILDVAVDIRRSSATFGQLFVPAGFAHGFVTLEEECHVLYKVDAYFAREADRAIAWNDPDLTIDWPLGDNAPILSDKDARAPRLAEAELFP